MVEIWKTKTVKDSKLNSWKKYVLFLETQSLLHCCLIFTVSSGLITQTVAVNPVVNLMKEQITLKSLLLFFTCLNINVMIYIYVEKQIHCLGNKWTVLT